MQTHGTVGGCHVRSAGPPTCRSTAARSGSASRLAEGGGRFEFGDPRTGADIYRFSRHRRVWRCVARRLMPVESQNGACRIPAGGHRNHHFGPAPRAASADAPALAVGARRASPRRNIHSSQERLLDSMCSALSHLRCSRYMNMTTCIRLNVPVFHSQGLAQLSYVGTFPFPQRGILF